MTTKLKDPRQEREGRIQTAVALGKPDRVPFLPLTHFLAAPYTGLPSEQAFYDYPKWFAANRQMTLDLEPDAYFPPTLSLYPGRGLDLLDCRAVKWPPHGVDSRSTYQFVEDEYMKEEDYDSFLSDPTDYLIRTFMPRIFGTLAPLSTLPHFMSLLIQGYKTSLSCAVFANPSLVNAIQALYGAAKEANEYLSLGRLFDQEMKELGFPPVVAAGVYAPFDYIGDMLRGMKGIMIDMFKNKEKLLAAMDRIQPILLDAAIGSAKRSGCPRVWIALHRGSDGFMSNRQFETFYWPGLRKMIDGLIAANLTPCIFFEGDYTSRLEYVRDLPKGKILGFFDTTDLFKASKIIGETICIAANMPVSILSTGTPEQVEAQTKRFIDELGSRGGFVMSANTVLDDAKIDLIRLWARATREYGAYN